MTSHFFLCWYILCIFGCCIPLFVAREHNIEFCLSFQSSVTFFLYAPHLSSLTLHCCWSWSSCWNDLSQERWRCQPDAKTYPNVFHFRNICIDWSDMHDSPHQFLSSDITEKEKEKEEEERLPSNCIKAAHWVSDTPTPFVILKRRTCCVMKCGQRRSPLCGANCSSSIGCRSESPTVSSQGRVGSADVCVPRKM